MKIIYKVLFSLMFTAIFSSVGFAVLAMVALSGGSNFHQVWVVALFGMVWLFLFMQLWGILKDKVRYFLFGGLALIMAFSYIGFEINSAYHRSIDRVEVEVNWRLYEPFREGSLVVIDEPSTLALAGDLPKLDGATALFPVYSAFVRAAYPKELVLGTDDIITCTQTGGAYRKLIDGKADIIFVAGPSDEQLQMAEDAGVELKLTPIGFEAFVFFVNSKNPIDGLSMKQVRQIYSGEIENWQEVGGNNVKIKAYQRPTNSGSQTALIDFMSDVSIIDPPREDVIIGMGGMISQVSSYRNYANAIGYSFLFFASEMVQDNKIKLLELDGIAPTRENVSNMTYPYVSEFYAVTAGTSNPNVEKLIDWILSEQGQRLIEKTGYTAYR